MNTIQILTMTNWMAEELSEAHDFVVRKSFGLEVPHYSPEDAWWFPQEVAMQIFQALKHAGVKTPRVISPGSQWLTSVHPKFLGRHISMMTVAEALQGSAPAGWWKVPEAKLELFPMEYRTAQQLMDDIARAALPASTVLQYTETTLDISYEFRFIVSRGEIVAESAYLDNTGPDQLTYYDGLLLDEYQLAAAKSFATEVAVSTVGPPVYVMDVAELKSGSFVLLEANAVAFSAWYGMDIRKVAQAIWDSKEISDEDYLRWQWKPDPYYVEKILKQRDLPIRPSF